MAHEFTLEDFAGQLRQLKQVARRPDPLSHVLDYFREDRQAAVARLERIIQAISPEEQRNPDRIGPTERQNIALACGMRREEIDDFLRQFERLSVRMDQMARLGFWQRLLVVAGRRRLQEAGER